MRDDVSPAARPGSGRDGHRATRAGPLPDTRTSPARLARSLARETGAAPSPNPKDRVLRRAVRAEPVRGDLSGRLAADDAGAPRLPAEPGRRERPQDGRTGAGGEVRGGWRSGAARAAGADGAPAGMIGVMGR